MIQYFEFACLRIFHEYIGGYFSDVEICPSLATSEIFLRNNFLFRSEGGVVRLLHGVREGMLDFEKPFRALFGVWFRDLLVLSATDFGKRGVFPIYRFSSELGVAVTPSLEYVDYSSLALSMPKHRPVPAFAIELLLEPKCKELNLEVKLCTKKLRWRYVLGGNLARDGLEIVDTAKGECGMDMASSVSFSGIFEPNGELAFTSDREIPLEIHSPHRFILRESTSGKTVYKFLPNLDARSIVRSGAETFVNP